MCVCREREGEKEIDTETEKYIERTSSKGRKGDRQTGQAKAET